MYKQPVDQTLVTDAFELQNDWNKLVLKAKGKDQKLMSSK